MKRKRKTSLNGVFVSQSVPGPWIWARLSRLYGSIGVPRGVFAPNTNSGENIMKCAPLSLLLFVSSRVEAFGLCWPSCSETTELDERTVAVSAGGSGLWSVGLNDDLLAAAATASLQHGYARFRLIAPGEYMSWPPFGFMSNGAGIVGAARSGATSAIARFFDADEPRGQGAQDARTILDRYED